jgi:hypothetical protein
MKEGLQYFEVSAKMNLNVQKMFYSAISELGFFDQFQIKNKDQIVEELGKNNFLQFIFNFNLYRTTK